MQRPADHLFAHPIGVDIGGVKEIDAQFQRALDEWPAVLFIQCPRMPLPAVRSSCSPGRCARLSFRLIQSERIPLFYSFTH